MNQQWIMQHDFRWNDDLHVIEFGVLVSGWRQSVQVQVPPTVSEIEALQHVTAAAYMLEDALEDYSAHAEFDNSVIQLPWQLLLDTDAAE